LEGKCEKRVRQDCGEISKEKTETEKIQGKYKEKNNIKAKW
jgi:hypothetical protein